MKHKLLYLLLFFSFLANSVFAQIDIKSNKKSGNTSSTVVSKTKALIAAPLATAGSACKEFTDATVRVFVTASGNSGDIIEWYESQESTTILRTGSIYSPFISKTTTFYVQSRSGSDLSVRVPVVASVFNSPPNVTLTVSPTDSPICKGVPLTFTANGGGDLFEFSIDNTIVQAMSTNRVYTTNTLSTGQVVKVKTRYAVTLDGTVSEAAWGTGAFEDNGLSAALSPSAVDGYLTSVKISGTEDKLIFGITGKLNANRSTLMFLDTKPGGFNIGNYGDEVTVNPSANGFNYFNNNPSTFDSYFLPDYCLVISTKDGGLTYFADIIELKTGTSTKVSLGIASNGNPSANFGVNNGNTGINDLSLGFEIAVLKSQIGYVTGDIKFFGITMKDDSESTFSVTNSFLSPERTSILDYGSNPINFNLKDPKAIVVSADAFLPCYKEAGLSVTIVDKPTTATVGSNQNNCSLTSTSLGGNTPTVGTGKWSVKSGPGTAIFSNSNSGNSTATVDVVGSYVFTWTISNGNCDPSMADITVRFDVPPVPPLANNQTECAQSPIQTLTATAITASGTTIVWYDAAIGGNIISIPTLNTIGTKTYYAEAVNTGSSCPSPSRTAVVLTLNLTPLAPVSGGNKTECEASPLQTLTATATTAVGSSIKWYTAATGGTVVANPTLNSIGTITYYAEAINDATGCFSNSRTAVVLTINARPLAPVSGGNKTECAQSPLQTLTATATVASGASVVWYDAATGGNVVSNPTLNAIGTRTYYGEAVNTASSCPSPSRTAVVLTINPIPLAPVSSGNKTECEASPLQTLTATATTAVGSSIKWYTAATGGTVVANPTLNSVGTITYYAEAITDASGCFSSSRTAVVLTINARPLAPISAGNKTECAQSPLQTLTATATVASGATVVWYDVAIGGNVVSNPTLTAIGTRIYYAEAVNTASSCPSPSRTEVVLTINPIPFAPVSGGNKTECEASPLQTLTATATTAVGSSVKWYNAATGGTVVVNPTLNSIGTITYYAEAVNDATGCFSNSRTAVVLTINARPLAPVSGGNKTECAQSPLQTLTATATVASGASVVWYDAATGGNVVSNPTLNAIGTKTYYAEAVNMASSCPSPSRTAVVLTINPLPLAPVSGGNKTECEASPLQTLTATATTAMGTTIKWYSAATGGIVVANPTLNSVGTVTYYAEAVTDASGCFSTSRTAVVLTINPRPVNPISGGNQTVCTNGTTTQTLTATASGSSITWYTAATGGNLVSSPTQVGVGTVTYYAESSNGLCISFARTAVTLTIVGVVPNPIAADQTVCSNGNSNQTLTATASGNTITWYTALTGGSIVANPTQVGVGSATYYAESSVGNCTSAARIRVILTITAIPDVPTVLSTVQPTCSASSGTITINLQANIEYSIGNGFQQSNVFQNLAPGNYTISVRFLNNTACPVNAAAIQRINAVPATIQFDVAGECVSNDYILTAKSIANSYDAATVEYIWKDENGQQVGTNSSELNVSRVLASKTNQIVYPLTYTLTIKSSVTGCETTKSVLINGIYCNIQKGISPDGNGSNEFLDLSLMDVRNLEIFNRYGLKVYSMTNYKNQWKGQTNKGEELPSATYYYVIQFNNGQTKTGWIYLIREK